MQTAIHKIKNQLILIFILIIGSIIQLSGANEIRKAILHDYKDTSYLILHLYNFHVLDGSYEKGNERMSGYNESLLLVYNLHTRRLIAEKNCGDNNNISAIEILGCSDSILWVYSLDYNSGLQGLNLFTLNRQISQAIIYNKLSDWTGRFKDAEWDKINDNFGFNPLNNNIIATNYEGKQFSINSNTFKVEAIEPAIAANRGKIEYFSKIIYTDKDTLDLYDGYLYNNRVKYMPEYNFIEGKFIIEQNLHKKMEHFNKQQVFYTTELQKATDMLSRIRASKDSEAYNKLINEKLWCEKKIDENKKNINTLFKNKKADDFLLSSNDNGFYVLQRNDKTNDSFIAITKVIKNGKDYSIAWKMPVVGMFYNIQLAKGTKIFKRFFGDFVPESSFFHIEEKQGNLIIIHQMQIVSISSSTGTINWVMRF